MPRFLTVNGLDRGEVISALQKHIRRGEEWEALLMAFELVPAFRHYLWKRLRVISLEDIGMGNVHVIPVIESLHNSFDLFWEEKREGPCKLCVTNAILALCRSSKSRVADHMQAAAAAAIRAGTVEIADWTLDGHTTAGRMKGRGLAYFKKVSTVLKEGKESDADPYKKKAYTAWKANATSLGWFA